MRLKRPKLAGFFYALLGAVILYGILWGISTRLMAQKLNITAVTAKETYNLSGETAVWHTDRLAPGENYKCVIKFMAVKNSSGHLFTSHGKGQYVHLGCEELKVEHEFISVSESLCINLKMRAVQEDLKLEDGTPFDNTRYSLKPVLTIEK